jgi:hypothetical protein
MNKRAKDYTIDEIKSMLRVKQLDIRKMENITKSSRMKLKKINEQMNKQERKLVDIISQLTTNEAMVGRLDNDYNQDNNEFSKEIQNVTDNLRTIRNSLADIVRKQ